MFRVILATLGVGFLVGLAYSQGPGGPRPGGQPGGNPGFQPPGGNPGFQPPGGNVGGVPGGFQGGNPGGVPGGNPGGFQGGVPMMTKVWTCGKCGAQVGIGENKPNISRCPHCGVRLGSGGGWVGGGIGIAVVVVCVVIGLVKRMANR